MGYFSNGSEGDFYESKICAHCVHGQDTDDGCSVWLAHFLFNYDQDKNPDLKSVLDLLIPNSDVPGYNEFCTMFHPVSPEYADLKQQYKTWLEGKS